MSHEILFGMHSVGAALTRGKRTVYEFIYAEAKVDKIRLAQLLPLATQRKAKIIKSSPDFVHTYLQKNGVPPTEIPYSSHVCLRVSPLTVIDDKKCLPGIDNGVKCGRRVALMSDVMNVRNFAAIIRSAVFLGCKDLIQNKRRTAPINNIVSRISAGGVEYLENIYSVSAMAPFLEQSKANQWLIVAADASHPNALDVKSDAFQHRLQRHGEAGCGIVLCVGNEGEGLSQGIIALADVIVKISPSAAAAAAAVTVDSLNVSVAAGILLSHIIKE